MVFLDKFLIQLLVAFMFPTNISQLQIPIFCVLMIQAESQPKPAVILWQDHKSGVDPNTCWAWTDLTGITGIHNDEQTHQNHKFRAETYSINIIYSIKAGSFFLPVTQSWFDPGIFCLAYLHTD